MMELLSQVALPGILVVLILREIPALIKAKNGKGHDSSPNHVYHEEFKDLKRKVDDMFRMHNVLDANGVPIWYFPHSMLENGREILKTMQGIRLDLKQYQSSVREDIATALLKQETARRQRMDGG